MTNRTLHFLLVDDDDYDVMAVRRAFQKLRLLNPVHVARDGVEALSMLRANGSEALPRPLVLLLDLNMPRMNGLELLGALRADEALRDLDVFVLTTSDGDSDRRVAAEHGVAGYVVKSDDPCADVTKVLDALRPWWRLVETR